MRSRLRSMAGSCIVLYAAVGFVVGMCPSSAGMPFQHQHHGKMTHGITCAWACQGNLHTAAIDVPSQPFRLAALPGSVTPRALLAALPPQLVRIPARAPPPLR